MAYATPNAWKLLTPEALAQVKAVGMNLASMSPAEVTQLNAEIGGTASENAKGVAFYEAQGVAAAKAKLMKDRPSPNAQPSDQAVFLRSMEGQLFGGPLRVYPEFGWHIAKDGSATAGYDLGKNDSVTWSQAKDGSWSYHHTWGGFDLGRTLDGIADAVSIVAASFGVVGAGQLVYALHALAGHGSPDELAASLKADYNNLQMSGALAGAVQNGDWGKVWNQAMASGMNLANLQNAFSPTPAPDSHGNLTVPPSSSAPHTSLIPAGYVQPKPKAKPMPNLMPIRAGSMPASVKALVLKGEPVGSPAYQQLEAVPVTGQVAMAVGLAPPPPTKANPTAGRTILGVPVVDVGIGAVVLGGLGFLFRHSLGL